ncbi:DUF4043 domain-containing protein [Acidisoma cellulosilytica]|uniref:DUF4043 domain-containing protein n=1 Tax=Acidisoma cellulosilyticum TaxID=2802395 RepID=A0A963Z2R7_9PROT|nr:DUF4043 domain-containing protein [Acidisoma cellulosilyticum]MCB8881695.1 DUF4043 domain-containing protein [Acidisoma cellulosilyticum]
MGIENFPSQLQPIIQQGFLSRTFRKPLTSILGYRKVAERRVFQNRVGQTITDTKRGLKKPSTTPIAATANTGLDNGMTSSQWSVEQYTLGIDMYADTEDLNMVTQGVGLAAQFVQNAEVNATQAAQSLDEIARNTLFYGSSSPLVTDTGGYLGGNTRVVAALTADGLSLEVDDIRGFKNSVSQVLNSTGEGTVVAISSANPASVSVNGVVYTCIGAVPDATNVSTAPGGISGTLTFSGTNVAEANGVLAAPVVISTAPVVLRPNGRTTTAALQAGDTLTMSMILRAVATLRKNAVPTIDGMYNCYIEDDQLLELFNDPQFQHLFRGAYNSTEFRQGQVFELLGVRYIPTTEAPQQASLGAGPILRAIIVGGGALIEGDFENTAYSDVPDASRSLIEMIDGVAMVTRAPLDRLDQIISQSWYWIGGFALPTDVTSTGIIPTATNSALKRAVILESL